MQQKTRLSRIIVMHSLFYFTATLSAVSILLLTKMGVSHPLPIEAQYPTTPNSDSSVCYMETENGATLNLSDLCEKVPESSPPVQSNSSNQACKTKEECLTRFGADNSPPPPIIALPQDGQPL